MDEENKQPILTEKEKLDLMLWKQKKAICNFCEKIVYYRKNCRSEEQTENCCYMHPKPPPTKLPDKTICEYCGEEWPDGRSLGGHLVNCDKNPKKDERNEKIAETRTGQKHDEETKAKISESVKKSIKTKKEEDLKAIRKLPTDDDKEIKMKFF
jgi:hypothetical protein